jgi:hypothetical protein
MAWSCVEGRRCGHVPEKMNLRKVRAPRRRSSHEEEKGKELAVFGFDPFI